jgi:rubrerythrin
MKDSIHHTDVLNSALAYLARSKWEMISSLKESRAELLRLMDLEEKAVRLFNLASALVDDPHLKSLFTMLAMDEEQHYAMLTYILENFAEKKEVIKA